MAYDGDSFRVGPESQSDGGKTILGRMLADCQDAFGQFGRSGQETLAKSFATIWLSASIGLLVTSAVNHFLAQNFLQFLGLTADVIEPGDEGFHFCRS